ncbi:MFS monocarboxylate transporter [Diaporthe helianthi]|uniref:MFS monocarboxylate transporter n=1 Tax=Diaporthe helianthi TaxID=158607 RepID=A0A2P5I8Y2_DIAHE|nr:MFS monocarboxylate transporter [Diaporthe helianthi]
MASPPNASVSLDRDDKETAETHAPPPGVPAMMPPPNGGTRAWLQVFGAFGVFFNTWGLLNTFGVFQTYYETGNLFVESSSNISWVGSIQAFLVLTGGLISGPLYDKGFLRVLIAAGAFLVVFGHMMLSLATQFWQVVLAQGFCIGLGAGLMFTPSVTVLQSYFSTKIGLASGIAAAGSSFGGIIYPIVLYRLVGEIGFPWSVRVIGFICLVTLIPPMVFLRQRVKSPRVRAMFDTTAFTDGGWLLFTFGCLLGFVGLYVMLFYLSFYGLATGTADSSMAFYIVPIFNALSMFGRTLPNWLSDKTGPLNVLIPCALICGVLVLCMQAVHNLAGYVLIAIFFGFFSGAFIALPTVVYIALTEDKSRIGTRIGMGFSLLSLGILIGGPGGGAILGADQDWTSTWVFGGVMLLASGVAFTILRIWRFGVKLNTKA